MINIEDAAGRSVLESRTGTIEGVVLDSLGLEPLEGAVVILDGPVQTDTDTDADGRFRFSSVPRGRYGVRVPNTALDTLGLAPQRFYVDSTPGEIVSIRLRSPGLLASLLVLCDQPSRLERQGVLVGYALDTSGNPAVGVDLKITWQEVVRSAPGRFSPS